MEEEYDSPDSDGHASIPSPTEISFEQSILPESAKPWHPPSPDPDDSDSSSDDDAPIRMRRNSRLELPRLRPSKLPESPIASRVLRPTIVNSDLVRSATRSNEDKRASENIDPDESDEDLNDADLLHTDDKDADIFDDQEYLSFQGNVTAIAQSPPSTPDKETGLSKRIGIRKNRNGSGKSLPWPSDEQKQTTNVDDSETSSRSLSLPYGASSNDGSMIRHRPRIVSAMTVTSIDIRNEAFEEIDASSIMDTIAQRSPESLLSNATRIETIESPHALGVNFSRKVSGKAGSDSFPPRTPPNKFIKRKHFQYRPQDTTTPEAPPPSSPPPSFWPVREPLALSDDISDNILLEGSSTAPHVTPFKTWEVPIRSRSGLPNHSGDAHENNGLTVANDLGMEDGLRKDAQSPQNISSNTIESSIPHYPYQNFNLWKLKLSPSARRMSMNTPPSNSSRSTTVTEYFRKEPPSPLGSEFRFSFKHGQRDPGLTAPPNSTIHSPAALRTRLPSLDLGLNGRRERSRSDPLETKAPVSDRIDGTQKLLFTPSRVFKRDPTTQENATYDLLNKFPLTKDSSSGMLDRPVMDTMDSGNGPLSSKTDDERLLEADNNLTRGQHMGGHQWSQIPQNTVDGAIQERDGSETSHDQAASSRSLGLGDVEVRIQTPVSVSNEGSKHDISIQDNRVTEFERHLPVTHLGDGLPSESQYGRKYDEPGNRECLQPGGHVSKLDNGMDHTRESTRIPGESTSLNPDCSPTINELKIKIEILEQSSKQKDDQHRHEKIEDEQTIRHLRAALEQTSKSTVNIESLHRRIIELEQELQRTKQDHQEDVERRESKFAHILNERDAEVNHLQGELDDLANIMPVDQSSRFSSRFLDDDGEEWFEEKSREISQFFDESIDHIIAEIHGDPGKNDDEAAEEAEMSLREMAANAGYTDLNKAGLAAFGIRTLRDENSVLKDLLCQSKEREEDFLQVHNDLKLEAGALSLKVNDLGGLNDELQQSIAESQSTIEDMRAQIHEGQTKLEETRRDLEKAMANNTHLCGLDNLLKVSQSENAAIEAAYSSVKAEVEGYKTHSLQLEQLVTQHENRLTTLQNKLKTSEEDVSSLKMEVEAYKNRNTELLRTIETLNKNKQEQIAALEQQIASLNSAHSSLIRECESANRAANEANSKHDEITASVHNFEEQIAISNKLISGLNDEISSLKQSVNKAETEVKQARSRFNVLLHESAEKETIWNNVKEDLQAVIEQKTADLRNSLIPYENALSRIAHEIHEISPSIHREGNICQRLAEELMGEEIANPSSVASVLCDIKSLDDFLQVLEQRRRDLEEKNERLKAAIKKWGSENHKKMVKVEGLEKANKELALRLKAEKKQNDEKIGQLILALRRD